MIKVYGIHGRTTAIVRIYTRSGLAYIEPEFKRGRLGLGKSNAAATYSTGDPTEQAIIEDSSYFGGLIKLMRVYDNGENVAPALATEKPAAAETVLTSVPDVTTKEEAVAYLKAQGAKAVQLRDDEAIKRFASKIGVSFPNLTL